MASQIPVQVIINATDNASKVFSNFGGSLGGITTKVQNLTQGQTILAGSMVGIGAAATVMGKDFIQAAGDMEQNAISFEVMLGSAEKAKIMLQDLTNFAARTPFNLQGVVEAGKQLLAYGFEQEDVITTTEMLGNVAAGLKIPLGDIIYLFGTLRAQGRAYTKDLNQFTSRGIPILDALAQQYGITTAEVFKFAEEGKIGFTDVEKAFQGMTGEGGQFFNLMDKQSKSTMGKVSNMEDSIFQLKVALGEALLPGINDLINALIPLIQQFGIFAKENPELITNLMKAAGVIGLIGSAVLILGPIISGFAAIWGLLTAAFAGIAFVVGPLLALFSPIIIIILAIAAVVALLALAWKNNWFDIQGKTQVAITAIQGFLDMLVAGFWAFVGFIQSVPAMIVQAWDAFKAYLYDLFVVQIPFAIGFAVGRFEKFVAEDVPSFINGVVNWFSLLPGRVAVFIQEMATKVAAWFGSAKTTAIELTIALFNGVSDWFSQLPGKITGFLSQLPGIITKWFNDAKDAAIRIAQEIFEGVAGWIGKVIDLFNQIIGKASEAIGKANEAFSAGRDQGRRQFGGPVSSSNSYLVGEKGPEIFTPSTAGHITPNNNIGSIGGGGGTTIQFFINAETIINSPNERRSFAEALIKDLAVIANAKNLSVSELLGDIK